MPLRYVCTDQLDDTQRIETPASPLPADTIVQTPPGGIFDRSDLQWRERRVTVGTNQGASVQEAYIPADRVEDFIAGERELLK